ncbi:DoxX family membrane protein [Halorussus sp. MSC15.2]|uniref:DoxX family membrane protein n=1 Tax=Halorussus sp. MSC15.2 TaxID=2283638 RepID=UPI0013D4F94E|nr:DoxX family membrane protein [Halorussus sp. MSC15.2]NEU57842.1 DoxX family membrane protein [Halorussus sp. MSC15.2]
MATTEINTRVNEFESTVGGVTVRGEAHSLSAWFVLALRLMMGYAFLHAGLDKLLAAEPFSATGYLLNAVPEASPLYETFQWMGQTPWFADFLAIAVPWGETLVGLALLAGLLTRLAAFFGAFMMLLFYFGNWDVAHGFINGDFAYMLVFLSVAAFGAGRILGLDAVVENYDLGGRTLVETYPRLRYVLG